MQVLSSKAGVRAVLDHHRRGGQRIALVPTMGNLHDGHMALVEAARAMADLVVVSIFVNPLQFDRADDLALYPRTPESDTALLEAAGVDLLYLPDEAEIYPHGREEATRIVVPALSEVFEGTSRPGHFAGVATVVCKLFNQVAPDVALFGEKDWQQLLVIRRMVDDLDLPVGIVGIPTIRGADGLAMSSRNSRLAEGERTRAPALYCALDRVRRAIGGGRRDFAVLEGEAEADLIGAGMRPDYIAIRRHDLLEPDSGPAGLIVLGAAWLGETRLIDSLPCPVCPDDG